MQLIIIMIINNNDDNKIITAVVWLYYTANNSRISEIYENRSKFVRNVSKISILIYID